MWLILAFFSAALLGCYDSFKKEALAGNAVIPVLFLNTLFCSLIFLPFILLSHHSTMLSGSPFEVAHGTWSDHFYILLKSVIVLSSWIFGYFGIKSKRFLLFFHLIKIFITFASTTKKVVTKKVVIWRILLNLAQ